MSINKEKPITIMLKKLFMAAALVAVCIPTNAQLLVQEYKSPGEANPISPCVFCADPTAIDYNGRVYVYGSNDNQQYIKNGKTGGNGYGDIKSIVVFSTDDMVNWTFHGTIDVGKLCSTWGWRFAASWAPSAVWRTNAEGEDEFFLYFANSGGSVGVLKASSPIGPWKSPLTKPMIDGDTPGVKPCNWIFDPGAVVDENGTGWIGFGGGDPLSTGSSLWPGNSRIAKLSSSMTSLDGSAVNMPAPYMFEASELNIMDGRFVYMKAQNLILTVDTLTLQLEKGEFAPAWADNALPEGSGAALIRSEKEIVDVAGKTESGGRIVTHLHFDPEGEVLVPAKNVITSPPAGYTPWDVVYMSGGTAVYTAYNSSDGFVTVFSAGGKTKTLSAVAESLMPLGDGRFLMWSAGARGLIIVDTNK